jgi:2-amino-4-hydroxy-6-hydroxymethyldihydropteridine diphosphokinase
MTKIFLSLGSNIQPTTNLQSAVRLLDELGDLVAVSSVWQSAPVGYTSQPDFFNAAVAMCSEISPADVYRDWIEPIEAQLARCRDPNNKNAPRTIDVDLSLYGEAQMNVLGHSIPDPDLLSRAFVAVPLAELDGDFVHPSIGRSLGDIANEMTTTGLIRRDDIDLNTSTKRQRVDPS